MNLVNEVMLNAFARCGLEMRIERVSREGLGNTFAKRIYYRKRSINTWVVQKGLSLSLSTQL